MKYLFYLILISSIVFSCVKEELEYSCNSEINAIVKSGKLEFSEISLSEFLEYDIELQRAIFRSFSLDKRKSFWLEKMDSLSINSYYSSQAVKHIEKLVSHIDTAYFIYEEADSLMFKNQKEFEGGWIIYAKDSLFWDDSEIHFIASSLCLNESQYFQVILELKDITINQLSGDCSCSLENDDCGSVGADRCIENGCQENSGCGFLMLYNCDGACIL